MATQTVTTASSSRAHGAEPFLDRAQEWVKGHRQLAGWIGTALVVAVVLLVWTISSGRRTEEVAGRELQGARFAFENQNLPLAASELARIVENYSGTNAAEEARLLLANVRLQQGQPQQAVEALREHAAGAGKAYRAQAFQLLGAAYENLGRFTEAAEAYESGAEAARLDFYKAQLLSDAGRAWVAGGDTAKAVEAYRRIVEEFADEGSATEAKVRLGELTKGTAS